MMNPEYGLVYHSAFLDSLPLITNNNTNNNNPITSNPIRLLSAKAFADLHLQHILSHPPDHVLFPFFHGLEGDNHAQNAFFHSSATGAPTKSYGSPATVSAANYAAKVPRYRGLVWVVCEEDLQVEDNEAALCVLRRRLPCELDSENESEEGSDESSSSSFEDEEEEAVLDGDRDTPHRLVVPPASDMDLDAVEQHGPIPVGQDNEDEQNHDLVEGKHMHPIHLRPPTIKTTGLSLPPPPPPSQSIPMTASAASINIDRDGGSSASSSASSTSSGNSYFASSASPSMTTSVDSVDCMMSQTELAPLPISSDPPTESGGGRSDPLDPSGPSLDSINTDPPKPNTQEPKEADQPKPACFSPPLLTSTFRPKDLLRKIDSCQDKLYHRSGGGNGNFSHSKRKDTKHSRTAAGSDSGEIENEWEFVPARVPDGISLRSFGIQVPVYATLADVVVYSPKGPTKRALALAERFRSAIERKRRERIKRHLQVRLAALKAGGDSPKHGYDRPGSTPFQGSSIYDSTHTSEPDVQDEEAKDVSAMAARIEQELEAEFLRYNVFVLSANEEETREEIPHLVMRIAINPEPSASAGWEAGEAVAGEMLTIPDPVSLQSESRVGDMGMELNMDMDMDVAPGVSEQQSPPVSLLHLRDNLEHDEGANTVDFAQREKDEMRDLTRASEIISCFPGQNGSDDFEVELKHDLSGTTTATHWDPMVGQVFLGNANDVPLMMEQPVSLVHPHPHQHPHPQRYNQQAGQVSNSQGTMAVGDDDEEIDVREDDLFNYQSTNDPEAGNGYDICIECHELAPFPSTAHLKAAEEHLAMLETMWVDKCKSRLTKKHASSSDGQQQQNEFILPPRPPPNANAVIHLSFPSSPSNTQASMASLMPIIKFLEKCIKPVEVSPTICLDLAVPDSPSSSPKQESSASSASAGARRWSSAGNHTSLLSGIAYAANAVRNRSFTTPHPPSPFATNQPPDTRSRPLKALLYSSDGYTESSVPALCMLIVVRGLTLPEAYLELQKVKRRSFFVYQGDLGLLKRVEGRLREERERENMHLQARERGQRALPNGAAGGQGWGWYTSDMATTGYRYTAVGSSSPHSHNHHHHHYGGRLAARSVSFVQSPLEVYQHTIGGHHGAVSESSTISTMGAPNTTGPGPADPPRTLVKGRPRANTSPLLPSLIGDHQAWFNDPRFDGSFPSRVLPFLYLGNLNHALNAYMLHALGITHVVSVGECALVPPSHLNGAGGAHGVRIGPAAHYIAGRGPGGQGSLWIEEREGRIKVLDIKGICDDGIDTLEPQLEPICDWIDNARQKQGGKVLVHCRVGVSRSATVTIAYVMKHLGISLVDAYLIVRSRRLSVLIQPNMRLLYNLCGWEIKLAKERAQGDEQKLKRALAHTLSWPYLAKEVHTLNEKYLH